LDKELQAITKGGEAGKRLSDKLFNAILNSFMPVTNQIAKADFQAICL
jgi:hypothetical protein